MTLLDAGIVDGKTHLTWTRRLNTGDPNDYNIQNQFLSLHYAYASSPGLAPDVYGKHSVTGIAFVNMITGARQGAATPNTLTPTPPLPPGAKNVTLGIGVDLFWEVRSPNIYLKLVVTDIGWIALGFGTYSLMAQSDVNVGWVDSNGCYFYDQWSADSINIPLDDTSLGGTSYLANTVAACSEINGVTTIEWIRPLAGNGATDVSIANATQWLLYAIAPQDGTSSTFYPKHTDVGSLQINFFAADPIPPPPPVPGATGDSYTSPGGEFSASWALFSDPTLATPVTFTLPDGRVVDSIRFNISAQTTGWVSFGISTGPKMYPSDFWTGWVTAGVSYFYDTWSGDYNNPVQDSHNDITLLSFQETGSETSFSFQRALVTGDGAQDVDFSTQRMYLEWAIHPQDGTNPNAYSKHTNYGLAAVNFLGAPTGGTNFYVQPPGTGLGIPQHTFTSPSGDFMLRWKFATSGSVLTNVTFEATWNTLGWVSMGFCDDALMYPADYYTGWVDPAGTGVLFMDTYSADRNQPVLDTSLGGSNSISVLDATTSNGQTIITFTRAAASSDIYDKDLSLVGKEYWLQWAYHSSIGVDPTFYQKHTVTGMIKINMLTGQPAVPPAFNTVVPLALSAQAYSYDFAGQDCRLRWELLPLGCTGASCDQIHLEVEANTIGWLSFGFGSSLSMTAADCYTGWVVDGTTDVYFFDTWSLDSVNQPRLDSQLGGTDSVVQVTGASQVNGKTTISFIRRLAADNPSTDIAVEDRYQPILYAAMTQDGITPEFYSKHSSYMMDQLNFFQDPNNPPPQGNSTNSYTSLNGRFTASWIPDPATSTMQFTIEAETTGWLSFGFRTGDNPLDLMVDADLWTGWVDGGQGYIYDTWSPSKDTPAHDAQDDLTLISSSETNGRTQLVFTRPYVTGDTDDYPIEDATVWVEWATFGTDGTGPNSYSKHTDFGTGQVNFLGVAAPQTSTALYDIASLPYTASPFSGLIEGTDYYQHISDDNQFTLRWAIEDDVIHFEVSAAATGWIAIGINSSPRMDGDAYVMWVSGPQVGLLDQWMPDYETPCNDGTTCALIADRMGDQDQTGANYSVTPTWAEEIDGKTTVAFRRQLDTSDALDWKIEDGNVYVTWAFHSTSEGGEFSYSKHDGVSDADTAFYVNLMTGAVGFSLRDFFSAGQWLAVLVAFILGTYAIIRWTYKLIKRCKKTGGDKASIEMVEMAEAAKAEAKADRRTRKSLMLPRGFADYDQEELPTNWVQCYTEDGTPYYWDTTSNETTFQRPAGVPKVRLSDRMSVAKAFDGNNMGVDIGDVGSGEGPAAPKQKATGSKMGNKVKGICSIRTYKEMSVKHWGLVLAFIILNIIAGVLAANRQTPANILGSLAAGTAFLLVLPATRNSIIGFLLGVPFDKSIKFHRWMGRWCVALGISHLVYSFVNWADQSTSFTHPQVLILAPRSWPRTEKCCPVSCRSSGCYSCS